MKLLHVTPIARGIQTEALSYFTNKDTKPGELVFVPLRSNVVPALVLESTPIEEVKGHIKASSFAMKKVDAKVGRQLLLPEYIDAAQQIAQYTASSLGAVLYQTTPTVLFDDVESLPDAKERPSDGSNLQTEKLIFEASEESRFSNYKALVREEFARGHSTFIATPTIQEGKRIFDALKKGVDEYVFLLHSELSKKKQRAVIETILKSDHPVLIIATPTYLAVPRHDIGTIVVERESARSYKRQARPFVNMRTFAEYYADALKARILFADLPLSIQTHYKHKQREYDELKSVKTRVTTQADQYIIDMRGDKDAKTEFRVLSSELSEALQQTVAENHHALLFNVRRGIAPSTVCEDCGALVTCAKCEAPVVLHKSKNHNIFLCHACGTHRSAKERCARCRSWKLKALGIGTQRVKDELREMFPDKVLFSIDKDSTPTYTKARKEAQRFYDAKGGILVCTEMALPLLDEPVALTGIVSLDSLLSIPDARIYEHIFSLALRIRDMARERFFLQTRQPELPVIKHATEGNISGFYEQEILMRRRFDYPPFTTLIKVTSTGTRNAAITALEGAEQTLAAYPFTIYPGFTPMGKNKYALHGLLKIPSSKWPDQKLSDMLRALPPQIQVDVDPTTTL